MAAELEQIFKKPDHYIGIDPDIKKSGFAWYSRVKRKLVELDTLAFFPLIERIQDFPTEETIIVISAGWLNPKSNWNGQEGFIAQKIAKSVGMNHQVGILLMEFCEHFGYRRQLIMPKKGVPKVNHEDFIKHTNWVGRTNEETRDAGMLVYGK